MKVIYKIQNLLLPLSLLVLLGCSSKIVSFVNPKANFKAFETYRLVSPKVDGNNVTGDTVLVFQVIKDKIQDEMERRNYKLSSVGPDLTLRYELTSSSRVQINNNPDPFDPFTPVTTSTVHEGILLLELYNEKQKLVWQGSYDLRQERKEKKTKKAIENAIGKIFTTYPYKATTATPDASLTEFKKKNK